MQEKVSIMCSWCGWENPSGKPRHRLCCTTPSGWIFPSTPGTHERYLYSKILTNQNKRQYLTDNHDQYNTSFNFIGNPRCR